ncbi:MAG: pitrilysin family protein [Paracoccaceae bacterium]|nr:pitrilysin family protein [Paracoccaceae bacterium]
MIRLFLAAALALGLTGPVRAAVDIVEVTSPGGITAWLVEEESIPFLALEIRFQGGSALDAPGKRGAINLMTGLLEEGAGDLDARGFAEAREALAASYEFDVFNDALSISARFLTENRDEAVDLLRSALAETRFDQDAIDRVRAQVIAGIRNDATDPNEIASDTFARLVYGDHPYGSSDSGTEASVSALTRDDLIEARDRVIAHDRIFVGAAGDITPEELGPLLDRLLGDLPEAGAPMPQAAEVAADGFLEVVPFDVPQSVAFFGHEGISRDDPDFFAAFVLNESFGGSGRQSRLSDEVREKRGLTYGIGTYLVDYDHADMVLGQVASGNEVVAEAIDVVRAEWARVAETGIAEDELEAIKTYLTGAYPLRFDGNGPIARIMVGMQMQGLPIDYINTRNDKVNAVTMEDISRVAARLYDPEALKFVVVGQPVGLLPTD